MDETSGISVWPLIGIASLASFLGWQIAKCKGRNKLGWAVACFVFPPAVIGMVFLKSQQRPGETQEFRNRWASLAAYDPEIKAAVERLSVLGPSAVEEFRMAYADVQTRDAIPLIVADVERRRDIGSQRVGGQGQSR